MTSGDSSVECKSVPAPPAASGPPPAASPPAAVQSSPPKAENKKKKPEKKGRVEYRALPHQIGRCVLQPAYPIILATPPFLFQHSHSVSPQQLERGFLSKHLFPVSADSDQDHWAALLSKSVFLLGFPLHKLQMEPVSRIRDPVSTFQLHIASASSFFSSWEACRKISSKRAPSRPALNPGGAAAMLHHCRHFTNTGGRSGKWEVGAWTHD